MFSNIFIDRKKIFLLLIATIILSFSVITFAQNISKPIFSHETGKYHQPISVTIRCDEPGARIYYTTDGSSPDENSNLYDGAPILVWKHVVGDSVTFTGDNDPDVLDENVPLQYRTMTLKAVAIDDSGNKSEIASAEYVIDLVDAYFNIPYADPPVEGGTKHQLDIYHPVGETNTPVLVFVHGGAWKQGDKNIYVELGNTFSAYYRVTTVIANYELSTDPWNAIFPEHILDVANAFAWIYEHIDEYGGDPENIYLFGQSAGAHLVSLLATDSNYLINHNLSLDKIKGVVCMSGAYELYDLAAWPSNPNGLDAAEVLEYKALFGLVFGTWDQGTLNAYSPQEFIKASQPPIRIIALNETENFPDMPGFSSQANNFYSAIVALNGPFVELKILNEEDIPPEVHQLDFPDERRGHHEEIYAINTRDWNSVSTRMVAEFFQTVPDAPRLNAPQNNGENIPPYATFNWQKTASTIYYHLQVSEDETFSTEAMVFDSPIADTSWRVLLSPVKKYFWRVSAVNGMGESAWSEIFNFTTSELTGVKDQPTVPPKTAALVNLYPNPFNGVLHLQIEMNNINAMQDGEIAIFDILGRKVYSRKVKLNPGRNDFLWQPENLSSGMYFVNFSAKDMNLLSKVGYVK